MAIAADFQSGFMLQYFKILNYLAECSKILKPPRKIVQHGAANLTDYRYVKMSIYSQ